MFKYKEIYSRRLKTVLIFIRHLRLSCFCIDVTTIGDTRYTSVRTQLTVSFSFK